MIGNSKLFNCRFKSNLAQYLLQKMLSHAMRKRVVILLVEEIINQTIIIFVVLSYVLSLNNGRRVRRRVGTAQPYGMLSRIPNKLVHMNRLFLGTDADCISNLRMDRNSFGRLCFLMRELGGLVDHRYVSVEEQVSMFLYILAHHKKNRGVKFDYQRSGQTVSHYIHIVLKAVLGMHTLFLVKPTPVPDDSTDPRWKWFKVHIITTFSLLAFKINFFHYNFHP
ncbi:hypothetical protein ACS0TY_005643 [Phlomoides rotata]